MTGATDLGGIDIPAVIHRQAVGALLRTAAQPHHPEQVPVPAEGGADRRAQAFDIRELPLADHGRPFP